MSYSYTASETRSFTVTHARHMAAKVATDLKRMQRLYGSPGDGAIADYELEATTLLKAGYLKTVTYGYKRDGKWIQPTVRYTARDLAGSSANDDDPGKVSPGANVEGASFYSYLTYNNAWYALTETQREAKASAALLGKCLAQAGTSAGHPTYSASPVACTSPKAAVKVVLVLTSTPGSPLCPTGTQHMELAYAGVKHPHIECVQPIRSAR